jgi:hypothetical protein
MAVADDASAQTQPRTIAIRIMVPGVTPVSLPFPGSTVARERYDPGDEAANGFAVGAPRPAHDPDQGAVSLVEHRPAGIAVADAEAGGFAEFPRIDQAELLGAWPVGCDQRDRAQLARGLAITLHADTEARDNEPVADRRRRPAVAERGRCEIRRQRRRKLDESQVGGIGP